LDRIKIGGRTVRDFRGVPWSERAAWLEEFADAGEELLADPRCHDMCFGGRPVTSMEMAAAHRAYTRFNVLALDWVTRFELFLGDSHGK